MPTTGPSAEPAQTPETLKATLQNANASPTEVATAISKLPNLLHQKDQDGTATAEEKGQLILITDVLSGRASSADTDKLASMLGMSPEKVSGINKIFEGSDEKKSANRC